MLELRAFACRRQNLLNELKLGRLSIEARNIGILEKSYLGTLLSDLDKDKYKIKQIERKGKGQVPS